MFLKVFSNIKLILHLYLWMHFITLLGNIKQEDPIDDKEDEFMRIALLGKEKVQLYYGNVIVIVPTEEKNKLEFVTDNKQYS